MKSRWGQSVLQLIAWHAFLVSVFVLAPGVLSLGSLDVFDWAVARIIAVACIHLGLISLEYSLSGTVVPRRLNGVLFYGLPVLYGVLIVELFGLGGDWLIRASILFAHSVYTAIRIAQSFIESSRIFQFSKRLRSSKDLTRSLSTQPRW